jgi:hypothetical protein
MHDESHRSRFDHQREVERLLEQIRRGVREVRRLQAAGVRAPALADRKRELKEARARLAAVIGGQVPHAVDRAA